MEPDATRRIDVTDLKTGLLPACDQIVSRLLNRKSTDPDFVHLLFTAPRVDTGNSTAAAAVAAALAKRGGINVLLVDTNLENPSQAGLWGVRNSPGLRDLVDEKCKPAEAIHSTTVNGVSLLPAGEGDPFFNWISSSARIFKAVDSTKSDFSLILWDLPPTGISQAAWFLGGYSDGIIFVLHSGRTSWEVAAHMKESLANHAEKFLGVILNRKKFVIPDSIYRHL